MALNLDKKPYLNLGCGSKTHPDWINVDFIQGQADIISYNLLNKLPFEDKSIKYIYHSHLLEHFSESDGINFTKECHRVLQNGGILRIVLPDLENIIRCYIDLINNKNNYSEPEFFKFHQWLIIELFDQAVREYPGGSMKECLMIQDPELLEYIANRIGTIKITENKYPSVKKPLLYRIKRKLTKMILSEAEYKALNIGLFRNRGEVHKWMYDKYSLTKLLSDIGFKSIETKDPYSSNIPFWENYEFDIKANIVLNPHSLYIEAIR